MNALFIFIPAIIMVALTAIAWLTLFAIRVPAISANNVNLDKVRTRELDSLLPEKARVASQHLINLFEVPVLFYVLIGFLFITKNVDAFFIFSAFSYVFMRIIHTTIHLSYNNVMHRFSAYLISSIILWIMWAKFAFIIFQQTL